MLFVSIVIFMTLFAGCNKRNILFGKDNTITNEVCIPPIMKFSYPIATYDVNKEISNEEILPSYPWEKVTVFPIIDSKKNDAGNIFYSVKGSREEDGYQEIWILERDNRIISGERIDIRNYIVFRLDTLEWRRIAIPDNSMDDIFFGENNQMWEINWNDTYSPISFYDEKKEKFLPDPNSKLLVDLLNKKDSKNENFYVNNHDGILWILASEDGIYRYEFQNGELEKMIELDEGRIVTATISPSDDIYFIRTLSYEKTDGKIYVYSPETDVINSFDVPQDGLYSDGSVISNIMVDKQYRLWISSVLWRDENGIWNKVISPPEFITDTNLELAGQNQYKIIPFSVTYSSSDGNVWFNGVDGTFRANPDTGFWCWVTTQHSTVLEDNQGYLWMAAGDGLYKRPIDR
jgi:hypothetical protein